MDKKMDRLPMESGKKLTHRLYPSLPSISRYEVFMPDRFIEDNLPEAALYHSENLREDTQSEGSTANTDFRMNAQILILEEQKQELLSINEKWAKEYRTMEQYYKEKVRRLKALLPQEVCDEGEKHITPYETLKMKTHSTQTGDGDINGELVKAEREVKRLQEQNRTLTRRGQHQHAEITRLNKALEDALQSCQPVEMSSETLQDVWKHQAEVYKEDFLKERKDREKLKGKYLELEKKFRKVRHEVHIIKSEPTWTTPPQPLVECACAKRDKRPNYDAEPLHQHCNYLQRRHTLKDKL
ncbi:TNFAIP3-interacting protein 1-like [Sphaeramia orbicularis]|uniref:TNFAIP3-interacting protein 1-like n=1 Tax=Sphaeramia orbicularis TaxID=375764 RepID=UPI0011811B3E|nr:TNFAIP3-interacting protein 1-like [Sphaeramia orbicularis]